MITLGVVGRMSEPGVETDRERVPTAESLSMKPVVLPETHDGTQSWDEWDFHFQNVATVNGWDDTQKLRWLRVRPTGRAQKALQRLPEASRATYAATCASLKALRADKLVTVPSFKPGVNVLGKGGPILRTI